jgi:hypothetical protein
MKMVTSYQRRPKAENGANTYTLEGTPKSPSRSLYLEVTVNSKERMVMKLAKG